MRPFAALVLLVPVVMLTSWAAASVPRLINYQGILTDSGGTPITGTHDLTFSVYPDSGLSAPVYWTETHMGVQLDNGLFNVILGGVVPLPDSLFAGGDRWMGIGVDAGPEMSPRIQITSVAWAFRAATADSAAGVEWTDISGMPGGFADGIDDVGGAGADNDWTVVGDSLMYNLTAKVGMGTASPEHRLQVEWGTAEFATNAGNNPVKISRDHKTANFEELRIGVTDGSAEIHYINDEVLNRLDFRMQNTDEESGGGASANDNIVMSIVGDTEGGKVGIGTASPTRPLEVDGHTQINGFGIAERFAATTGNSFTRSVDNDQVRISGGTEFVFTTDRIKGAGITLEGRDFGGTDAGGMLSLYSMLGKALRFRQVTNDGVVTETMMIDGSGNVGIGTTTPTAKLEVAAAGTPSAKAGHFSTDGPTGYALEAHHGASSTNAILAHPDYGVYAETPFDINQPQELTWGALGSKSGFRGKVAGVEAVSLANDAMYAYSEYGSSIHAVSPNGTAGEFDGDVVINGGAYRGDIGPNNGAPFPRPAYDSGWVLLSPEDDSKWITHNVGGNELDYVVDLEGYGLDGIIKQPLIGRITWTRLSPSQILVTNYEAVNVSAVRIRIWVYR